MNGCNGCLPPIDPAQAAILLAQAYQALNALSTGQLPVRVKTENYETEFNKVNPSQLLEYIAQLNAIVCSANSDIPMRGAIGVIF